MQRVQEQYDLFVKPLSDNGVPCDKLDDDFIAETVRIIGRRTTAMKGSVDECRAAVTGAKDNVQVVCTVLPNACKEIASSSAADAQKLALQGPKHLIKLHEVLLRGLKNPTLLLPNWKCGCMNAGKSSEEVEEITKVQAKEAAVEENADGGMLDSARDFIYKNLEESAKNTKEWKKAEELYNSVAAPLRDGLPSLQEGVEIFSKMKDTLGPLEDLLSRLTSSQSAQDSLKGEVNDLDDQTTNLPTEAKGTAPSSVDNMLLKTASLQEPIQQAVDSGSTILEAADNVQTQATNLQGKVTELGKIDVRSIIDQLMSMKGVFLKVLGIAKKIMKPSGLLGCFFQQSAYLECVEEAIGNVQEFFNVEHTANAIESSWNKALEPLGLSVDSLKDPGNLLEGNDNALGKAKHSTDEAVNSVRTFGTQIWEDAALSTVDDECLESLKTIITEFSKDCASNLKDAAMDKGAEVVSDLLGGKIGSLFGA